MKHMRIRYLLIMCSSVIVSAIGISTISIWRISDLSHTLASTTLNSTVNNQASELNISLTQIEDGVNFVNYVAKDSLSQVNDLKDPTDRLRYSMTILDAFDSITGRNDPNVDNRTPGAFGYYFVYNPNLFEDVSIPSSDGFYFSKSADDVDFKSRKALDVSKGDDSSTVIWWNDVVSTSKNPTKQPLWIDPYINTNVDNTDMLSYIIPVMVDSSFVGVVGMDIDFAYFQNILDSMRAHSDTGNVISSSFAYLLNSDGSLCYHPIYKPEISSDHPFLNLNILSKNSSLYPKATSTEDDIIEYRVKKETKFLAFTTLSNHMKLVLTAPRKEMLSSQRIAIIQIAVTALVLILFFSLIYSIVINKTVKPVTALSKAVKEISNGNFSVYVAKTSDDEVGQLVESTMVMKKQLQQSMKQIQDMAYQDGLTKVRNKASYEDKEKKISEDITLNRARFGIIMCDINNLKKVNDTYGHEGGDANILLTSESLQKCFDRDDIFRIGGDEFAVVLRNEEMEGFMPGLEKLKEVHYQKTTEEDKPYLTVSFSYGYCIYDAKVHSSFSDVFKTADEMMYQNKTKFKASQK